MDTSSAAADDHSGRTWASGIHVASNYALNGKIMLCSVTVLFAAVILILCIHGYARWLFHRQNRQGRRRFRAYIGTLSSMSAVNNFFSASSQALDKSILEKIPVFVYSSKNRDLTPLGCAVCLSEFEENEEGRVLPKCKHVFHVDCIDTWFRARFNCPLCRAPVTVSEEVSTEPVVRTTEPAGSAPSLRDHSDDLETGGSSSTSLPSSPSSSASSSPARFQPESNRRRPMDLVGILVEKPRGFDDTNLSETGSKFPGPRVVSLKRIWSI